MNAAKTIVNFTARHNYLKYAGLLLSTLFLLSCNHPATKKDPALNPKEKALHNADGQVRRLFKEGKFDSVITESKKELVRARLANDKKKIALSCASIGNGFLGLRRQDSAINYYKTCEAYAAESNSLDLKIQIQMMLSGVYYDAGKPDSVNVYKNKMSREVDTIRNVPLKMRLIEKLADIYGTTNQPEKAIQLYFQVLEHARAKKDSATIAVELSDIGEMYEHMANYKKAVEYALESISYMSETHLNRMVVFNDLGADYVDLKEYQKAVEAYKNAIKAATKMNYYSYVVDMYVSIASPYIELKQYDKATGYLNKAMAYYTTNKYESGFMYVLIMKGKMERNKGNYQASIDNFEKALEIAKRTAHYDSESYVSGLLADVAGKAGLYEKAYKYEAHYNTVRDSIEKATSKKNIADLEIKYQTNEKEQRITLLNQQDKLKDIELRDQKRNWWLMLLVVAFLSVTAFLLYRSFRIKRDSNKLLEEKNGSLNVLNAKLNEANTTKTRLFSVLTHDLRSPISNLFLFLTIQKNHAHKLNQEQQKEHNERLIHSAENLMESMEDLLVWSKSQMESFAISPEKVEVCELITYAVDMHRDHADGKQITLDADCPDSLVLITDVNFLKIVLRNLISNAIKFTPAGGSVVITAEAAGSTLKLKVADTGAGMTPEQLATLFEWNSIRSDSSGMGLRLAKEFILRLGGDIDVSSKPNTGTTFTITVPGLQAAVNDVPAEKMTA